MSEDQIDKSHLECFGPFSASIEAFANAHNMKIERYVDQGPMWNLLFAHPQGGVGMISILRDTVETVKIVGNWWYDDDENFKRYAVNPDPRIVQAVSGGVSEALEMCLKRLLSLKFGDWDAESESFEEYWKPMLADERLSGHLMKYPKLRI